MMNIEAIIIGCFTRFLSAFFGIGKTGSKTGMLLYGLVMAVFSVYFFISQMRT